MNIAELDSQQNEYSKADRKDDKHGIAEKPLNTENVLNTCCMPQ